ncbi:MAG: hypothetical protein KIC92_04850 [Clostridiales bacterium]|nr:hypothetical protein [Clostridiales bacterium]
MDSLFYKKEQAIDFAQVVDIESIKELVLHNCTVSNFTCIIDAKALKSIALVNCNITSEDLSCLKKMEKLKTIRLNVMKLDNILCLADIASLRELSIRRIEGINYEELEYFSKLQSLALQETEVSSFVFMKKLKNLKELEFNEVSIGDLNFLYDLPRLKEFTMRYRAEDETALNCISKMKYLQCFQYPVPDMSIYKECSKISSIGVDSARVQSFYELEGKKTITDVMFYNLETEKQYKQQLAEVNKFLDLRSYGYMGKLS